MTRCVSSLLPFPVVPRPSRRRTRSCGQVSANVPSGRANGSPNPLPPPSWPLSSHRASVVLVEGQRFAIGKIVDNRVGHHKPVLLEDWYRVVRNTELDTPGGSHQRRRIMWD